MGTDLSIWAKCEKQLEGISMNELMEISEHQIIMRSPYRRREGMEHTMGIIVWVSTLFSPTELELRV